MGFTSALGGPVLLHQGVELLLASECANVGKIVAFWRFTWRRVRLNRLGRCLKHNAMAPRNGGQIVAIANARDDSDGD